MNKRKTLLFLAICLIIRCDEIRNNIIILKSVFILKKTGKLPITAIPIKTAVKIDELTVLAVGWLVGCPYFTSKKVTRNAKLTFIRKQ